MSAYSLPTEDQQKCGSSKSTSGGAASGFYMIPACEVEDYPATVNELNIANGLPETFEGDVVLGEDFVLDSTTIDCGYWRKITAEPNSVILKSEKQGSTCNPSYKTTVAVKLCDLSELQSAMLKKLSTGKNMLAVSPKADTSKVVILGMPNDPIKVETAAINFGGDGSEEDLGNAMVFSWVSSCPLIYHDVSQFPLDVTPNT